MPLTFLTGGARSGKSSLAISLGQRHARAGGNVVFVATCPRIEGDADLDRRIARHRAERPDWRTIEEQHDLVGVLGDPTPDDLVIVDCLTLWVSNVMLRGDSVDDILGAADAFASSGAERPGSTVVVSNEVGMSVHPETELGREYRDLLGSVNQRVAARATDALLLVAGRALRLEPTAEFVQ